MLEFVSAVKEADEAAAAEKTEDEQYTEFKVDGRTLRAYRPTPGQLIFMMGALGRGQSEDSRLGSVINIMMETLRDSDADYLEGRLLERDPKKRIEPELVNDIFEALVKEWFRDDTASDS